MLHFDEATHTYFWNGIKVPGVTSILKPLTDYSHMTPEQLEKAKQEGLAVHFMVESHFKGRAIDLPDWMVGHQKAMLAFIATTGFRCWLSEERQYHPGMRYAGTLDLFGELTLLKDAPGTSLIDVKRSLYAGPVIGLQLAAYAELIKANKTYPPPRNRFALVLRQNGTYRLERFDDPGDLSVFSALLTTQQWKERHGRP